MTAPGAMAVLGVDPGLNGALVGLDGAGRLVLAEVMPTLPDGRGSRRRLDVVRLAELLPRGPDVLVVLEQLQGRAQGQMGARSALTIGRNHGLIEGLLVERGLRHDLIEPRRWQRAICPGTGDPKARAIQAVQRLLPGLDLTPGRRSKPHDGLADAGCLALFALRELVPAAARAGGAA